MTWDYRVVRRESEGLLLYEIHEAFYDEQGLLQAITEDACCPQGETLDELADDLDYYRRALRLPILDYDAAPSWIDLDGAAGR